MADPRNSLDIGSLPGNDRPSFTIRVLRLNPSQKLRSGFVIRILGYEFAADGEVEDGLAELLDVFGARGEAREVAEMEAGVLAELVGICAVVQSMQ